MIAGLAWQVVSLLIFTGISGYFYLRVRRAEGADFNVDFDQLRSSKYFKASLWALGIATLAVIVRSVFRCAELSEGFDGELANDEVTFMVLEGAMMAIAAVCLTGFHPGVVWKGQWAQAVWHTRASKGKTEYAEPAGSDTSAYSLAARNQPTRQV